MADVKMYNSALQVIRSFPEAQKAYWTSRGWYPYDPAVVPSTSADPFPQYALKSYVTNAIAAIVPSPGTGSGSYVSLVDNGDGTFTASSSTSAVTDNGDGTYTITS